jgi:hypothetical protein
MTAVEVDPEEIPARRKAGREEEQEGNGDEASHRRLDGP